MRTVFGVSVIFLLCFAGSACGAKVVVDTPGEGGGSGVGGGSTSSSGPSTCTSGEVESCYSGPAGVIGVGVCQSGIRICSASGTFGACQGETLPSTEVCGNGLDEDCNGAVDDPAVCNGSCVGCAEYTSDPSLVLCPNSAELYKELFGCLCAETCAVSCSANLCVGAAPAMSCLTCATDVNGCGNEFSACANDI
ncbi:hypothetical protein [Polyangium sorediatum]|uniref:Lipoprotein n=1 Tax=Polyangium sorediatum TaxID=889274 RepID=A0ABT6P6T5_9BACT|nr:hypothetical protein [Polyangium sorediatum]MDI1436022.1 hypothetical protein [Polyangium sorediatum]